MKKEGTFIIRAVRLLTSMPKLSKALPVSLILCSSSTITGSFSEKRITERKEEVHQYKHYLVRLISGEAVASFRKIHKPLEL